MRLFITSLTVIRNSLSSGRGGQWESIFGSGTVFRSQIIFVLILYSFSVVSEKMADASSNPNGGTSNADPSNPAQAPGPPPLPPPMSAIKKSYNDAMVWIASQGAMKANLERIQTSSNSIVEFALGTCSCCVRVNGTASLGCVPKP